MSGSKKPADPALRPAQVCGVQEFCKPGGSGPWGRALKPLMNNLGVNNEELKRFPRTKSQNHCKCPNLPVPLKKALCSQSMGVLHKNDFQTKQSCNKFARRITAF